MKSKRMKINFEGQGHQIDSNTLVNVLIHYNNIIEIINKEYGGGRNSLSIKVNAIEKGSFIVDISIIENVFKTLFSAESVAYIAGIATIADGVYRLYKSRKGRKVSASDDIDKILTHEQKGLKVHIVNIYNLQQTREAISSSVKTASEDPGVEGLNYKFDDESAGVTYERKDFGDLAYDGFDDEDDIPGEKFEDVEATLSIRSLSFERGGVWGFVYNGFPIKSTVKDDVLMEHINKGAKFAKGDSIIVTLRIIKRWNPEYKTYVNKSYKIIEFKKHIQAPKQGELF